MATVANVITLLNGSVSGASAYSIFGYIISTATIELQLDYAQEMYEEDYFDEAVLTDKADKVDKIITIETCINLIADNIMGLTLTKPTSYSTLEHSVSRGSFPDIIKSTVLAFEKLRERFIRQLVDEADFNDDTRMGSDYWDDGLDLFNSDTIPY